MNALDPTSSRLAWRLGLWGLATWLVLRLHDATFAAEHSIGRVRPEPGKGDWLRLDPAGT